MPFGDFAALAVQEGLPETFSQITLTFVADGQTVATLPVEYGAAFDPADAPALPEKAGNTAAWEDFETENITFDQTVAAVYTPYTTVIASAQQRQDGRAVLLAEGSFGEGTLTLTSCEETPAPGTTESWQFTLPAGDSDAVKLHYLPVKADSDLYLRGADGTWRKAETTDDGSYRVCALQAGDNALAEVPARQIPLPLLAGAGAALAVLLLVVLSARRHRKKKAAAQ